MTKPKNTTTAKVSTHAVDHVPPAMVATLHELGGEPVKGLLHAFTPPRMDGYRLATFLAMPDVGTVQDSHLRDGACHFRVLTNRRLTFIGIQCVWVRVEQQ